MRGQEDYQPTGYSWTGHNSPRRSDRSRALWPHCRPRWPRREILDVRQTEVREGRQITAQVGSHVRGMTLYDLNNLTMKGVRGKSVVFFNGHGELEEGTVPSSNLNITWRQT